eukprot:TRINITY_DN9337_c3_g1_i1.p1 TRINITY_DN9337_c3_g1~~TRINITY_DN9337_c3_g1_i1.p1  ORF type:complete len:195 (+),score=78.59 TRINITY_DN9337_c3_g1_i1:67-585(+)
MAESAVEVTICKGPGEKLGCRLSKDGRMILQSVTENTAAHRSGAVAQYIGRKLTHVNGHSVSSSEDCAAHLGGRSEVQLRFQVDADDQAEEKELLVQLLQLKRSNSESVELLLREHDKSKAEEESLLQQANHLEEEARTMESELQQLKKLRKQVESSRLATYSKYVNFVSGE